MRKSTTKEVNVKADNPMVEKVKGSLKLCGEMPGW